MVASTFGTGPFAIRQREIVVGVAARTKARGRRKAPDDAHVLAGPRRFVLQLATEIRPTGLSNAPGQCVVSHHPRDVEVFQANRRGSRRAGIELLNVSSSLRGNSRDSQPFYYLRKSLEGSKNSSFANQLDKLNAVLT